MQAGSEHKLHFMQSKREMETAARVWHQVLLEGAETFYRWNFGHQVRTCIEGAAHKTTNQEEEIQL
jgi:hypothetical protein